MASVDFDHHDPQVMAQPWERYAEMRTRCPIAWSERYGGFWVVSGYRELYDITRDWQTFSSASGCGIPGHGSAAMLPIESDPPLHDELRTILNPIFSPQRVAPLEPSIRQIADDLINQFIGRGSADLVSEFAAPIQAYSLFKHILGMGDEQLEVLRELLDDRVTLRRTDPPAATEKLHAAIRYLADYVERRAAEVRRDDVVSLLLDASLNGEPLPPASVTQILLVLTQAGLETTTDAIANALLRLGKDANMRDAVREDSGTLKSALEEFLRLDAPVQALARTVVTDTERHGISFKAGDKVLLAWGSGNRDSTAFDQPDEIDIHRAPNHHLSFGMGIHRCVGSNFARLVYRTAVTAILNRIPKYELTTGSHTWRVGEARGVESLPVRFEVRPAT